MCCATAVGDGYCPLFVSTERSIPQVVNYGTRDGIDLAIEIAKSADVTKEIFEAYADTVLIPAVEFNRTFEGCNNRLAILFCVSYAAH
jgi:hypothetical protein